MGKIIPRAGQFILKQRAETSFTAATPAAASKCVNDVILIYNFIMTGKKKKATFT
ncbi:hypothetical protein [Longitalea luteola]|uniref:hypothetical protein n=1 Tax=Longitalea luteola TaxID=2812563 RepID=UPI001A965803|nr:hypothetical protein [Longitalea luteola]